jgi:8-oxo-dGTP diphosphatase
MWNAQSETGMKNKKVGASIIFLNNANQILLFLRDDKPGLPFPNCWDVLGGGVEVGETPLECITREMHEEIGVKLENPHLFDVYDMPDRIEYTFWQRANFDIGQITLTEGQCLKWFTQGDINSMTDKELAFGFKSIILDFFRQKPFE